MFVKGPPDNHAQLASFDCSDSNAWPVVDTIWAGLNGLGALTAAGDEANPDSGQVVAVGVAWLVVSGISAIYGYSKVSKCGDAKHQRDSSAAPQMTEAPPDPDTKECLKERRQALAEARRASDPAERTRLYKAAPLCTPPPAPSPPPPPSVIRSPVSSLSAPRLRASHRDQPAPPRSLAMRPAQER